MLAIRPKAIGMGRKMVILAQGTAGKRLRSGIYLPAKETAIERRCLDCENKATRIVIEAHFRTGGDEAGLASAMSSARDFLGNFAKPGCSKCGGTGFAKDRMRRYPGSWNGVVLSVGEDVAMIEPGHIIKIPTQEVPFTEYIWNPVKQMNLPSGPFVVVGDDDRGFVWESDMALIFTREDVVPWLVLGDMASATSQTRIMASA